MGCAQDVGRIDRRGAAALAAGLGFLELGSDIAGSIRNPSHFCGVYGHKSTLDVVPGPGAIGTGLAVSTPSFMGVAGPMARGAEDLRIMLEVIGGPVPAEAVALQWKLPPARRERLRDYRIGYVLDDPFCAVTGEVRDVLTNAIDALRKASVNLHEGWPKGIDPEALFDAYYFLLMARNLAGTVTEWQRRQPESDAGAPWQYYEKKMREAAPRPTGTGPRERRHGCAHGPSGRNTSRRTMPFCCPAISSRLFRTTTRGPRTGACSIHLRVSACTYDVMKWISLATLSGCPATVAPVGRTRSGLPVGLQIMGPYLEDATPIDIARLMAGVVGGFEAPPGYA